MTTRPQFIPLGRHLLPGFIAFFLFAAMAATFLVGDFNALDTGVFDDISVISGIGYALIGAAEQGGFDQTENFLVALILIAIVLDAALDGALMLASQDDEGGDNS